MASPATIRCTNCGKLNRVAVTAEGVPRCGVCQTPLPWVVDADPGSFDAAIDASMPVLIDFWAEWCGPCRIVSPIVERLAAEYAGRLKVVKFDVESGPEIAARYKVQGIPLLVLLRDTTEVDRLVGAAPEGQLREWLDMHLAATGPAAHEASR